MPAKGFKRYDPRTKAAIIEAALAARKAGGKWTEVFQAGREAGYHGSQLGLEQMVRKGCGEKSGRRGRPRKAKASEMVGDVSSIGALIEKIVKHRIRSALDGVIADLQRARG